jgi:hypothetical protein
LPSLVAIVAFGRPRVFRFHDRRLSPGPDRWRVAGPSAPPSYAGILLALAGIGVAFGNGLSLAALLALPAVGLMYRIRVEESALSATLGAAYVSYTKGRKRIIPLVW